MNTSLEAAIAARLRDRGPIKVAIVGAGACATMVARHLAAGVPHVQLIAICNRTLQRAAACWTEIAGVQPSVVQTPSELSKSIAAGKPAITSNPDLLSQTPEIEVIIEITGTIEFAANAVLQALQNGKHVVLVNAELDSTLGPILKVHAERAGKVLTHTDGEEPGVAMSLLRYLRSLGLRAVAAGNLKGMIDRYRTPDTQREFAAKHGMDPAKVASFADGTKLSMESTILANASGFGVGVRGMHGPRCAHVRDMAQLLPRKQLMAGGLVDYALGAEPFTGAFAIVHEDRPAKCKELAYFKMGDGPFYVFYTPYHLPQLQIASTIARAVLFNDATVAPAGPPICEVIAIAKRDLAAGTVLDGVGGFDCYGVIENRRAARAEALLPIGLSEGCRLKRAIAKDSAISSSDVEFPANRLCDKLWAEQEKVFSGS